MAVYYSISDTTRNDFEVILNVSVAVTVTFNSRENMISGDKLAEDVLVSIKIVCLTKGDREFGSVGVNTVVRGCKQSSLVVSKREILVGVVETEGTVVMLIKTAARDAKASLTHVERGSSVSIFAEGLEVLGGACLSIVVELEDHVAEDLFSLGHREDNSWVGSVAVVVDREIAIGDVKELLSVHLFILN